MQKKSIMNSLKKMIKYLFHILILKTKIHFTGKYVIT